MQTRLSSVQQALLVLIVAALAIAVLARPEPENARMRRALTELEAFREQFDRAALERALLESALSQGRQPLATVVAAASGTGRELRVNPQTPTGSLEALGLLQIPTLEAAQRFSEPNRSLSIAVADASMLGKALAWRVVRDVPAGASAALESVSLRPARVSPADLTREVEAARLSSERIQANAEVASASDELDKAEQAYETRRKWKLPWKHLVKFNEERKRTKAELTDKQRAANKLERRYTDTARAAEHAYESLAIPPLPQTAVARVVLSAGAGQRSYEIPVALSLREVPVQSLTGSELRETQRSGLWDEVRGLEASAAIAAVQTRFNWHYRYVELSGIKLGGMTVLQLVPCVLPLLLGFSLWRMRAVADAYNPFTTRVKGSLPRVGFGSRMFDALALVVLPLTAAMSAIASLVLIDQVPAIPVLTGVVGLVLGVYAFMKLGELQSLMEDVVRSHSQPPPDDV